MKSWLRTIKKALSHPFIQHLKQFRELALLLSFYLPYLISLFSRPAVWIEYNLISTPVPIATHKIVAAEHTYGSRLERAHLRKFVTNPTMLQLQIQNGADKAVSNFSLSIGGVLSVSDIGVESDSFALIRNSESIGEYQLDSNGKVHFPWLTSLPPGSTTTISVWGEFGRFMWFPNVEATVEDKKVNAYLVGKVTGYPKLIIDHFATLIGLAIAFFLLVGFRRRT